MEYAHLDQWPLDGDGEPERAALLETQPDFSGFWDLCCALLESCGIPFDTQRPGAGEYMKIAWGFSSSGLEIYVPASRLAEATELLRPAEGSAVDLLPSACGLRGVARAGRRRIAQRGLFGEAGGGAAERHGA